jgi:hypothetical protein
MVGIAAATRVGALKLQKIEALDHIDHVPRRCDSGS